VPPTSTAVAAVCALVAMLITLFSGPMMVGVKVTVTEQEAPAASGDEETQLSASEKSPPVPTLSILTGEVAVFVSVTLCVPIVPNSWLPKLSEAGDGVSKKGVTVARIDALATGWPAWPYVAVTQAFPGPIAVIMPAAFAVITAVLDER
jgi:hypothetical protein